jgi:transposase-like protein
MKIPLFSEESPMSLELTTIHENSSFRRRVNMTLTPMRCTDCGCKDVKVQRTYTIKHGEQRAIYACDACGGTFSSTSNTPMAHWQIPISVMAQVLSALTEGMGINAVTCLYGVSQNSIYRWQERRSG